MIRFEPVNVQKDGGCPNSACPDCGEVKSGVVDSRSCLIVGIWTVRRIRKCPQCKRRFTTIELTESHAEALYENSVMGRESAVQASAEIKFIKRTISSLRDRLEELS